MRCQNCNQSLLNLPPGACPGCGTPFKPSEHDFEASGVRFCCPHCDQAYYGTSEKGHLIPSAFQCASCGQQIHMDRMILRPRQGADSEQAEPVEVPWLSSRQRGLVKAWFSMLGLALFSPRRLAHSLAESSSLKPAVGFAALTVGLIYVIALLPGLAFLLLGLLAVASAAGGGPPPLPMVGIVAVGPVIIVFGMILLALLWGPVTHGVLRLTGRTEGGMRRTCLATWYSSGAGAFTAVPVFGLLIGWMWWIVSAILMVTAGQKVHGVRAAIAVLTLPVLTVGGIIGFGVSSVGRPSAEGRMLTEAREISDLEDRLAAFETFLEDYPDRRSSSSRGAYFEIGKIHESRGNNDGAVEAYVLAATHGRSRDLKTRLEDTYSKKHGDLDGLEDEIDRILLARPKVFLSGRYAADAGSNRVVLAELFTGAECTPCVAADLAFDGLVERYDRDTVALLQYHLHIPGPDPLTNPDAVKRAGYYAVRGTPSVFVNGARAGRGGGLADRAERNFNLYKDAIESQLTTSIPAPLLSLSLTRDGTTFTMSGGVELTDSPNSPANLRLHLILAEKVVHYTGSNGIHFHHFAVRKIVSPPEGLALDAEGGRTEFLKSVDLSEVNGRLSDYLDEYEQERDKFKWLEKPSQVDGDQVVVVAFVQDDETKDVLQAAFADSIQGRHQKDNENPKSHAGRF